MKTSRRVMHRVRRCPAYPGAADRGYFLQKALNTAIAIVSGMGLAASILFLLALS